MKYSAVIVSTALPYIALTQCDLADLLLDFAWIEDWNILSMAQRNPRKIPFNPNMQ